ncbi:MAG: histidinol-phosphate transaminase [Clostridia bacterium]|nr:histidinol-phosphate transaminase [Clostridia bacterium]
MSRFLKPSFEKLVPYTPGEQPKDNKYIKLNTNESPFAPSKKAIAAAKKAAKKLQLYSDPECLALREKLAEIYGAKKEQVIVTNGSDEVLNFAFMTFCDENTPAAFADITYGFYKVFAAVNNVPFVEIPLNEDFTINVNDYCGINKTIFIANPNAPTGIALTLEDIEKILISNPNNIVVIDEAYTGLGAQSAVSLVERYDNLLVTMTFSKTRSMAGARLGFGIGNKDIINDLNTVRYSTNPYNVNSMTLAAGIGSLADEQYTKANCKTIMENRLYTTNELKKRGFSVLDSLSNFVFATHPKLDANELYLKLKENSVLVRHFTLERIKDYNRITIGTKSQMQAFFKILDKICQGDLK